MTVTPPLAGRRALADALEGAVLRNEIYAEYQPQVDLQTGQIVGAEALSRWRTEEFGRIPPANFIPLAEDTGAIHEIGRFMIIEGFRCAADWARRGVQVSMSVNVSPIQLRNDEIVAQIADNLDRRSVAPEMFSIEITESLPLDDLPAVIERLNQIRALGVGVSIDDFGSGFSSVELIESLPASELKFDLSLMHDRSDSTEELMAHIVSDVKPRGIRVVAEGIETVSQLYRARSLGCDRAQGFLTGRPVSCSELELMLERP